AELVAEEPAHPLVGAQSVGLAATAIQSQHQLRPQTLAVGMRGHEAFELAAQRGVTPELKIRLDAILEHGDPEVVEMDGCGVQVLLVGELSIRSAAPQRKRGAEPLARGDR